MMAISMFGAIFTWFMIFLTHYCFRRYHQRHGERNRRSHAPVPLQHLVGGWY